MQTRVVHNGNDLVRQFDSQFVTPFDTRKAMNQLSTAEKFWTFIIVASRHREGIARHAKPSARITKFVDQLFDALYAGRVQDILGLVVLETEASNVIPNVVNCLPQAPWLEKISKKCDLTGVGASRTPDRL